MATIYERLRYVFTNERQEYDFARAIDQEYERGKSEGFAAGTAAGLEVGRQEGRDSLASAMKENLHGIANDIGNDWVADVERNGQDNGDLQQYFRGRLDIYNAQAAYLEELKSHGQITIDPPKQQDFSLYKEQVERAVENEQRRFEDYGEDDSEDQSVYRLIPVTPEMKALADRVQERVAELSIRLKNTSEEAYGTKYELRQEIGYLTAIATSLTAGRQDIDLTIDIDTDQDENGIVADENSYAATISRISPVLQQARALGFTTDVSLYRSEPEQDELGIPSSQETPATLPNNYGYLDAQIQQVVAANRASRAAEITQSFAIPNAQPAQSVAPTRAQQVARETPRVEQAFGLSL